MHIRFPCKYFFSFGLKINDMFSFSFVSCSSLAVLFFFSLVSIGLMTFIGKSNEFHSCPARCCIVVFSSAIKCITTCVCVFAIKCVDMSTHHREMVNRWTVAVLVVATSQKKRSYIYANIILSWLSTEKSVHLFFSFVWCSVAGQHFSDLQFSNDFRLSKGNLNKWHSMFGNCVMCSSVGHTFWSAHSYRTSYRCAMMFANWCTVHRYKHVSSH